MTVISGHVFARPADVLPKFARQAYFDKGWNVCLEQFLELFHRYGYIYKPLDGGTWVSAKENWKLCDSEILKSIACAPRKFFIGTRSGRKTRYAVLDIDAKSKYHSKEELHKLLNILSAAGFQRSSLYRSSFSGGWHLYIFFEEWINSAELRRTLLRLLSLHDYDIAKGMLEIFPHPGNASLGMGLRLPLQEGFAWLDKETLEVEFAREQVSPGKAIEFFIDVLESDANSFSNYKQLKTYVRQLENIRPAPRVVQDAGNNVIPINSHCDIGQSQYSVPVGRIFGGLPSNIHPEVWMKGRAFHIQGLTGPSQRAEAIFSLSHYFFYGDPSRDMPPLGYGYEIEREWAIKEFLDARHNGQSLDISRGKTDAFDQASRAANWLPTNRRTGGDTKKYIPVQPPHWAKANSKRSSEARKKIQWAHQELRKLNRSFTTVELADLANVSRTTLNRHSDIWRQDYEDLAENFFAMCTGEYNAVEEILSPPGLACSVVAGTEPSGLLETPRLVSNLSFEILIVSKRGSEAVDRTSAEFEDQWHARIVHLTSEHPSLLQTKKLRSLLVVLLGLVPLASLEEEMVSLMPLVAEFSKELERRISGVSRLEPP